MRTVIVFEANAVCVEQPHPLDAQFLAYRVLRGKHVGKWLSVAPAGGVDFTDAAQSYQAFTVADNASYIIADRTAFGGGCFHLGYLTGKEPLGPVA